VDDTQSVSTFIVRIRHEFSLNDMRWYGRIEHLQSGRYLIFQDAEKLIDFINASSSSALTTIRRQVNEDKT